MKASVIIIVTVLVLFVILLILTPGQLVYKKSSRVLADLKSYSYVLELYKDKYHEYPSTLSKLVAKELLSKEPIDS